MNSKAEQITKQHNKLWDIAMSIISLDDVPHEYLDRLNNDWIESLLDGIKVGECSFDYAVEEVFKKLISTE